jgi:hypothetical protein
VLQVPAARRDVDLVLLLERRGERYVRHFDVVRLGDVDAATALSLGPGGAALVGLARGVDLDVIGRASREGRYTASQLARVIPEEVAMHSSLFEKAEERGVAKGLAKGVAKGMALGVRKGRIEQARRVCAAFVMRHHPEAAPRVLPAIEACSSLARLDRWTLRVPEVSGDELVRLVTAPASSRSAARRAPRPARRATSR